MTISSAERGEIAFLNRRTSTTANFFYRPPAGFVSGLAVAEAADGSMETLALTSGGPFSLTLVPGTYKVYVAGTDALNTIVMVSNVILYEHPATLVPAGDAFQIEWRTDYNTVWAGDDYDKDTIRERQIVNATAHWLQWRIRGTEQNQRLVLRNMQVEARMEGMAEAASQE